MKLKHQGVVLAIIASMLAPALAQDWVKRGERDRVALYERDEPNQILKSYRGVIRVKSSMKTVLALVLVRETFPQWVANVLEDSTLADHNPDSSLCYIWIKGVWPTADRDVVAHVTVEQDPTTLAVAVIAKQADPSLVPLRSDRVRMPKLYSGFTMRPLGPSETEVQLDAFADPGGSVPAFAANMVAKDLPSVTLSNLAKLVETPGRVDVTVLESNPFAIQAMRRIKLPDAGNNIERAKSD